MSHYEKQHAGTQTAPVQPEDFWKQYNATSIQEALIALHEAGHALICYAYVDAAGSGHRGNETSIDPARCIPRGVLGYCQFGYLSDNTSTPEDDLYQEDEQARAWEKEGVSPGYEHHGYLAAAVAGAAAAQLLQRQTKMSGTDLALARTAAKEMGYRGQSAERMVTKELVKVRAELCQEQFLVPLVLTTCSLLERKTIPNNDSTVESIFEYAHEALADRWDEAPDPTGHINTGIETWSAVLSVVERLLQAKLHPGLERPLFQIVAATRDSITRWNELNKEERLLVEIFGPKDPFGTPYEGLDELQYQAVLERCDCIVAA